MCVKHNIDLDIKKMTQYVMSMRKLCDLLEKEIQQALLPKDTDE